MSTTSRRIQSPALLLALALLGQGAAGGTTAQDAGSVGSDPPRPLPRSGAVPPITSGQPPFPTSGHPDLDVWRERIEELKRRHFGSNRNRALREEGLAELGRITDHLAFQPMIEVLAGEDDEVLLTMLEHFARQGEAGQAALAWVAINGASRSLRYEATLRIGIPAVRPVLVLLDRALRQTRHDVITNAAILANALDVFEAIPLLMFNQVTRDDYSGGRELASIAVGTQTSYVQDIVPVVGNSVGAVKPIIGTITEGTFLTIEGPNVLVYRTEVHSALLNLAARDWGRPTEHLGWDMSLWWSWYNEEYVPHRVERARERRKDRDVTDLIEGLRGASGPTGD
jgi:hypothetical protein